MKKKLIVSGDSVTDIQFRSSWHPELDTSWRKWPEYIAEYLDMELVCLARGGQGNTFVYSTLLDEITKTPKEEIGYVIAAWSQGQRREYQINYIESAHDRRMDKTPAGPQGPYSSNHKHSWTSWAHDKTTRVEWQTRRSLREMQSLQILCERYDLPYRQLQTGHLFEDWYDGDTLSTGHRDSKKKNRNSVHKCLSIIESYDQVLNTDKFIGWPISKFIGGFSMQNKILGETKKEIHDRKLVISKTDGHPNAKGQKAIADFLIKFII